MNGKGFSSTDPVAFKIPKVIETLCLNPIDFRVFFLFPPWSISGSGVCLSKGLNELSCAKGEKEEGSSLGASTLEKVMEVLLVSFML